MKQFVNFSINPTRLPAIVVFAILILLAACNPLRNLNRAQNKFNEGATLENLFTFDKEISGNGATASPASYYTSAYESVKKALQDTIALRKDDVLASAYNIKALCEWRLKMYDAAKVSAKDAVKEYLILERKGKLMSRDLALMEALPHLIGIEQANTNLKAFIAAGTPSFEAGRKFYLENTHNSNLNKRGKLQAAIQAIGTIRENSNNIKADFATYLVQAQLAGLKTWADGIEKLLFESVNRDTSLSEEERVAARKYWPAQRKELDEQKTKLLDDLMELKSVGKDDPLIKFWDDLI